MSAETLFDLCTAAPFARNAAPDKIGRRGKLKQSGVLLLYMKIPGAVHSAPGILLRRIKPYRRRAIAFTEKSAFQAEVFKSLSRKPGTEQALI